MDEIVLSKLQGYVRWADEVHAHKQDHLQRKLAHFSSFRRLSAPSPPDLNALHALLTHEQLPLFTQKVQQMPLVLEVLYRSADRFSGFHAEELLKELCQSFDHVHLFHISMKDTVAQQSKIVRELRAPSSAFESVTFEEVFPTLHHLLQLEQEKHARALGFAQQSHQQLGTFLQHLKTSHARLSRIADTASFVRDTKPLYEAAYLIGLCGLFLAYQYGVKDANVHTLVDHFREKIAEEKLPLPSL